MSAGLRCNKSELVCHARLLEIDWAPSRRQIEGTYLRLSNQMASWFFLCSAAIITFTS